MTKAWFNAFTPETIAAIPTEAERMAQGGGTGRELERMGSKDGSSEHERAAGGR